MSGSFKNAPVRTVQEYGLQVSRGEVGGAQPIGAYGRHVASGAVTNNVIWPDGAFTFPDQTVGETISIVSTSAEDALTLTGVRSLEIFYLDVNLTPQVAVVDLTGVTPVVAALTGVRFIQEVHADSVGAAGAAVGTITLYREGAPAVIFDQLSIGTVRASSSLRMVPKGKRAVVVGIVGSSISGTSAAKADIALIATEIGGRQFTNPFIFFPQASIGVQDGGLTYNLPVPGIFQEGTVIGMRVTLDKGATVSGDWFGWLEDTPPA